MVFKKILLAFLIIAMVFAVIACSSDPEPEVEPEVEVVPEELYNKFLDAVGVLFAEGESSGTDYVLDFDRYRLRADDTTYTDYLSGHFEFTARNDGAGNISWFGTFTDLVLEKEYKDKKFTGEFFIGGGGEDTYTTITNGVSEIEKKATEDKIDDILKQYLQKTIIFDFGINPAVKGHFSVTRVLSSTTDFGFTSQALEEGSSLKFTFASKAKASDKRSVNGSYQKLVFSLKDMEEYTESPGIEEILSPFDLYDQSFEVNAVIDGEEFKVYADKDKIVFNEKDEYVCPASNYVLESADRMVENAGLIKSNSVFSVDSL